MQLFTIFCANFTVKVTEVRLLLTPDPQCGYAGFLIGVLASWGLENKSEWYLSVWQQQTRRGVMSEGSRGVWDSMSVCLRLTGWRGEKARALRLSVGPQAWGRRRHDERSPPGPTGRPAPPCCANVTRHPHGSWPQTGSARRAGRSIDLNNIMTWLT